MLIFSAQVIEDLRDKLVRHALDIVSLPYEPDSWILRASDMLNLGFPELAAGDAYKSIMLSNAALDYGSNLGENARMQFGMGTWLRDPNSVCLHNLALSGVEIYGTTLCSQYMWSSTHLILPHIAKLLRERQNDA